LRGAAAAAACLLGLASTGAMVTAAVVGHTGPGTAAVLTSHDNGNGDGSGDGKGHGNGHGDGRGLGFGSGDGKGQGSSDSTGHGHGSSDGAAADLAKLKAELEKLKGTAPKPQPKSSAPKPVPHANPVQHHATTSHPAEPQKPAVAPTAKVVVDSSDPAPFSAQAVAAAEAARVLPVESLGPLSGISFGSGLFIWPLLLAVDVLALAVIARMALRRRLVSAED